MGPEGVDAVPAAPVDGTDPGERLVRAPVTVRHEVPLRTLATGLAVLAVLWLLAQLWTLLLSLFVALLLTAALDPPVSRLERRGVPRAASITIFVLALAGVVAGVAGTGPPPIRVRHLLTIMPPPVRTWSAPVGLRPRPPSHHGSAPMPRPRRARWRHRGLGRTAAG